MKTIFHISILVLVCLSAACTLSQTQVTDPPLGPAAWIDAPLDGSSLPLAETQVVSHATDPSGITSFELSVNGKVLQSDPVSSDQAGNTIAHISQDWLPDKVGVYLLSVRAANKSGIYGPYAYAHVTVGAATPTAIVSPTSEFISTVTLTATPTVTSTPSALLAVATQNTNCHDGPDKAYITIYILLKGQSMIIDGISQDKNWVWVLRPDLKNSHCWLSISVIQVIGDLSGVQTITAPTMTPTQAQLATSTATPTRTPKPTRTATPTQIFR